MKRIYLPKVHNGGLHRACSGGLPGLPTLRMEYLSPRFSIPLHLAGNSCAPVGIEKSALSLHPSLSTLVSTVPLYFSSLSRSIYVSLSLPVSGDLQQAMKSTHVSLTGCSIRAELRVIFIHL